MTSNKSASFKREHLLLETVKTEPQTFATQYFVVFHRIIDMYSWKCADFVLKVTRGDRFIANCSRYFHSNIQHQSLVHLNTDNKLFSCTTPEWYFFLEIARLFVRIEKVLLSNFHYSISTKLWITHQVQNRKLLAFICDIFGEIY